MDDLKKLYIMITNAKSFDSTCFDSNVPTFMHRNTIFPTFIVIALPASRCEKY